MKSRRFFVLISGLPLVALAAFGAGSTVSSPEQSVADAAPPTRSVVLAEVRSTVLVRSLTARGDIGFSQQTIIDSSLTGEQPVTARRAKVGQLLDAGDALFDVGGVPTILCESSFSLYRPLGLGDAGPDVEVLRECLTAAGAELDTDTDIFDATLETALLRHYRSLGFDLTSTIETSLLDEVEGARDDLAGARESLAAAEAADSRAAADAERAVAAARRGVEMARQSFAAAEANERRSISDAEEAVRDAEARLERARQQEPSDEDQVAEAEASLRDARSRLATVQEETGLQTAAARAALADAEDALQLAGGSATDTAPAARRAVSLAEDRLDAALASAGARVTPEMVAVAESLPRRVVGLSKVDAEAGSTGVQLTLASASPDIRISVSGQDAQGLSVGGSVEVEGGLEATISAVDVTGEGVQVVAEFGTTHIAPEIIGRNVRVTIEGASTGEAVLAVPVSAIRSDVNGSTYVLVADPQGLELDSDGVAVVPRTGAYERVGTSTGLVAGGLVEVTPDAGLRAGDVVVLGDA